MNDCNRFAHVCPLDTFCVYCTFVVDYAHVLAQVEILVLGVIQQRHEVEVEATGLSSPFLFSHFRDATMVHFIEGGQLGGQLRH